MAIRRKRKPLPQDPVRVEIESLTHDGRGIARIEGIPVFIHGALPGEEVSFLYTDRRRDFREGKTLEVHRAAPHRVEPPCPSYGICGGCSFQHVRDDAQIEIKQALLVEQFHRVAKLTDIALFEPMTGPGWGYRQKARLGVKFVIKKGRVLVGFRERSTPFVADLPGCPVLDPRVGTHFEDLAKLIEGLSIRDRVPQIEVAMGDAATALVFRILEDLTPSDEAALIAFGEAFDLAIEVQRQGPESVRALYRPGDQDLSYELPDEGIHFRFKSTDFTQVNMAINRKMVARVMALLDPGPNDRVLDLFSGIGNFTLPLAKRARWVVGVEGSETAVRRALENAESNQLQNIECYAQDLTKSLADCSWAKGRFDKLLLDPSRAGALEVLDHIPDWAPERIVYVSCNPSTLARDAGILVHQQGYRLVGAGVMDMFPQTAHVESIAVFERANPLRSG